ncbi:MAG: hypothetical protein J1E40_11705 [Oscillospiraceae bacterium]|nr:hypothetical protein [Oscillospiraceae bacterium]
MNIFKVLEELSTTAKKAADAVSNGVKAWTKIDKTSDEDTKKMQTYLTNNAKEATEDFGLLAAVPAAAKLAGTAGGLGAIAAIGGAVGLAAMFDYTGDYIDQLSRQNLIPESAQEINNYTNVYNAAVQEAKRKIKEADDNAEEIRDQWERIQTLVDGNGKLTNTANESEFQKAINLMNIAIPDLNIEVVDNQIQNYDKIGRSIYDDIDEVSKNKKESYLHDSYLEALRNIGDVERQCDIAQQKLNVANTYYQSKVEEYNAYKNAYNSIFDKNTSNNEKYVKIGEKIVLKSSINLDDLAKAKEKVDKAGDLLEQANFEYGAISGLENSYKSVMDEYEEQFLNGNNLSYPDVVKTPAQLAGEDFGKRMRARKGVNDTPKADQPPPTNIVVPDKEVQNIEQPPAKDTPNEVYMPETADLTNSLINDVIGQFSILPEVMMELGQQSLVAFTEGFTDDELIGERITEAAQKIADVFSDNMGDLAYQSGGEAAVRYMEGFEEELDGIYERIMAERELAVSGMTAGQQMVSFNYSVASQPGSRREERIVLENRDEITVKLDRDVVGKSVMEYIKEYKRRTGT